MITAVTSRAASAAADLLASGDYAIAYPNTSILYHGLRLPSRDLSLTAEVASVLSDTLKISNNRYAMLLARKSEQRFMLRYVSLRSDFEGFREKRKSDSMSDLECFFGLTSDKLSGKAKEIAKAAKERQERYQTLLDRIWKIANKKVKKVKRAAQMEGMALKAIIDFEIATNKSEDWTFGSGGIARLYHDFFLFHEYMGIHEGEHFKKVCRRWADFVLTDADKEEINQLPEGERAENVFEKVFPTFLPAWSFFVALCHVLQEGENELTAVDACWLGLIDEVISATEPIPHRAFAEFSPDPKAETDESNNDAPSA